MHLIVKKDLNVHSTMEQEISLHLGKYWNTIFLCWVTNLRTPKN